MLVMCVHRNALFWEEDAPHAVILGGAPRSEAALYLIILLILVEGNLLVQVLLLVAFLRRHRLSVPFPLRHVVRGGWSRARKHGARGRARRPPGASHCTTQIIRSAPSRSDVLADRHIRHGARESA